MLLLQSIDPADWPKIARRHRLGADIPDPMLRRLEIDPAHGLPLTAWARCLADCARDLFAQWGAPDTSTDLKPGTEDKIALMEARIAAGRAPLHPADKHLAEFEGGTDEDRQVYTPEVIDNGRNTASVKSARHTSKGVEHAR